MVAGDGMRNGRTLVFEGTNTQRANNNNEECKEAWSMVYTSELRRVKRG
jgi:hypothetical protein